MTVKLNDPSTLPKIFTLRPALVMDLKSDPNLTEEMVNNAIKLACDKWDAEEQARASEVFAALKAK